MRNTSFALIFPAFLFIISPYNQGIIQSDNSLALVYEDTLSIQKDVLHDKIMGGWAGQVIGCTYGGPTEFRYLSKIIQDSIPIAWDENRMKWYYDNHPGLYDDIYMDLTFVEVMEKEGLDASAASHANAFAHAKYKLWHANQAARYNILNGIKPPASGYWENNPHADDIDFQIEADFAGLMSPGMINTASEICDKVGHIMNYGDGWYGGVFIAAMYSTAFISDDIELIVNEGLKSIPEQSDFYRCISDVISWYKKYPLDWKSTWFECEKKWSSDIGCPYGVFKPFDIDAKINAAYIVIGLLYGNGDYGKTIDISTRCGQDSDCNPASAGGILGTMLGYSNIPAYWKQGLDKVESLDFKYTRISLNDVYIMGYNHALKNIEKNKGLVKNKTVLIRSQKPVAVKYEKGFVNHFPLEILSVEESQSELKEGNTGYTFGFEGNGFVVRGKARSNTRQKDNSIPEVEVYIDGALSEKAGLPTKPSKRRTEICWKYNLKPGKHTVKIELVNPDKKNSVFLYEILIYNDQPKELL